MGTMWLGPDIADDYEYSPTPSANDYERAKGQFMELVCLGALPPTITAAATRVIVAAHASKTQALWSFLDAADFFGVRALRLRWLRWRIAVSERWRWL